MYGSKCLLFTKTAKSFNISCKVPLLAFLLMKYDFSSRTSKTEYLQQQEELFYTFLFVILCWRYKDMGILKYFCLFKINVFKCISRNLEWLYHQNIKCSSFILESHLKVMFTYNCTLLQITRVIIFHAPHYARSLLMFATVHSS